MCIFYSNMYDIVSVMITKEVLLKIGEHILEGMAEKEACILSGVSHIDLVALKSAHENIRLYIEKMEVTFKRNHLVEIQKNKSEKNSQWLLEKLRPDEFGSRGHGNDNPTINIISAIIKDIQNDSEPIVSFRGNRTNGENTRSILD